MDLNKIEYFQAVASSGNISKASKTVGLSQPALTLQIQALEHSLGFKLFERHNRGLILTEEGKMILVRARALEEWKRETQDIIHDLSLPKGKIIIGTYTTASSYLIAPIIKPFFEQYPDISFDYKYPPTDEIINKVKNMEIDCAILSETPNDPLLEITPFFESEIIYVGSKETKLKSIKPNELSNHPFLSYPIRMDYCYQQVEKKFGKYLTKCSVPIESESFDTLKNSLRYGLGNSFMPRYIVKEELKNKILKEIQVQGSRIPVTFSFITRKDRKLPTRVQKLKDYLTDKNTTINK